MVYEITNFHPINNYPTLKNALFGAVKLTENADTDKYKYFSYAIGFDRHRCFLFGDEVGKNVIIFGVDMSSSPYIDNKGKDISIFGKRPTQRLVEHSLTAEKMYSINFTKKNYKVWIKLAL